MSFAIEIQTEHHGWSDDPSLLGDGHADNAWPTEAEALQALADLVATGFDRERLRVVEIDGYEISIEPGLNAITAHATITRRGWAYAFDKLTAPAELPSGDARAVKDCLTAEAPLTGHLRDATKMAPPPAEGEVAELVAWLIEQAVRAADCKQPMAAGMLTWAAEVAGEHAALLERQAAELERLHSAAPVAWLYRGEPDYAGHPLGWRENWQATTSRQLAESASRPGMPIPLVPAHALPLPSEEAING